MFDYKDTLFRPCSFVKSHAHDTSNDIVEESSNIGLIDTLHSVAEDCCQEQGELTGVRSLKSKPDASKKTNSRFSRAAIKTLKDWLDEHQHHPYPSEEEKDQLSKTTGLRVTQINTWLANARRRGKFGKNKAAVDGFPEAAPTPTTAIGIPGSANIAVDKWSDMNPLERWKHSPPQNEPAPFTAIADALGRGDLPDYAEEPSSPSTLGYRGLGSSRDDSSRSNQRALSVTSLEKSTSNSAASSAAWSNSRDSLGSYSSFGSSLNGRKERRRRRKMPSTILRKPANDKKDKKDRIYQCTFCTDTFKSKYDWTRHEKTLHLSLEKYLCCPLGPETFNTSTGQRICAYCHASEPSKDHIESHNHRQCVEKGFEGRTFYRKDHLRQHLRLVHDSKLLPHMEDWRTSMTNINSRCGFCSQRFTVWSERNDHLAAHFKNGSKMSEWKGCRGLDPAIAALVNTAMPPYLIGQESSTVNPFSATQPMKCMQFQGPGENGGGPTTCWEILTVRLGRFAKEQTDKGVVLTDQMLQSQARRIVYDSDDPCDNTAADSPEWLDLFKRAHALDYIPHEISGTGKNIPEDLELYGDLGMRIPLDVQLRQSAVFDQLPEASESQVFAGIEQEAPLKNYPRFSSMPVPSDKAAAFETICDPWPQSGVLGQTVYTSPRSGRSSLSQFSPQQGSDALTPATFNYNTTPANLDTPQNSTTEEGFDADINAFLAEAGYQASLQPSAGDIARQQNAMLSRQYGLNTDLTPQQAQHQLAEMNAAMAGMSAAAVSCGVSTIDGSEGITESGSFSNFLIDPSFSNLISTTKVTGNDGMIVSAPQDPFGYSNTVTSAGQEMGLMAADMTMQDLDGMNFGDMDFGVGFD